MRWVSSNRRRDSFASDRPHLKAEDPPLLALRRVCLFCLLQLHLFHPFGCIPLFRRGLITRHVPGRYDSGNSLAITSLVSTTQPGGSVFPGRTVSAASALTDLPGDLAALHQHIVRGRVVG